MPGKWVNFRHIKDVVSIEMVLAHYRIELRRVVGNRLRGRCPLPTHSSQDSAQSFAVDFTRNIWACHSDSCISARAGQIGGNVLDFVSVMENCSIRNAALTIQSWFGLPVTSETRGVSSSSSLRSPTGRGIPLVEESKHAQPLGFHLQPVDMAHDYLCRRGVDYRTAEFFGVGFFSGPGVMSGRVVFPIHNGRGELIAYAGRAVDTEQPRYRFPAGFRKSLLLFNLHRAIGSKNNGTVVVVGGFFDCLKVHQAGVGCVVALMGCTMSGAQERLLRANFRRVILFLDGDDPGRSASSDIAARLVHCVFVRVLDMLSGVQPDEMSPEQVRALLKPAMDCAAGFDIQ